MPYDDTAPPTRENDLNDRLEPKWQASKTEQLLPNLPHIAGSGKQINRLAFLGGLTGTNAEGGYLYTRFPGAFCYRIRRISGGGPGGGFIGVELYKLKRH